MLIWRLLLGISISVIVIGLCVLDVYLESLTHIPGIALFPLLVLIIVLLCKEMLHIAHRNDVFPIPSVTYLGCILIAVSAWGASLLQHESGGGDADANRESQVFRTTFFGAPPISKTQASQNSEISQKTGTPPLFKKLEHLDPGNWALSAFALAVICVFGQEMYLYVRPGTINVRIAYTIMTIVYVGLFSTFVALIRLRYGFCALIAFVAIIKLGDVGAYTVGRLFGRNKMAPGLSPGKTIEGACGAILFSCGAATLSWYLTSFFLMGNNDSVSVATLPWWLLYGAILGVVGMFGDLAESLLKRDAEVKDAGSLVPGFGGVMDLMDSLLVAAPVAYALLTLYRLE